MFKSSFRNFLRSIVDRFKYFISSESSITSELSSKLRLRHIKKIIRKDIREIRKGHFKKVLTSWGNRGKRILPIINLALRKIFKRIFHYIDKITLEKVLYKKRALPKDFYSAKEIGLNSIPATVSVVLNTKNSPPYFEDILRRYKHQVGLNNVEIIVIDSGSSDDTLNVAKEYGCKIIEIRPEEFRHGRARNIGIEAATGKYIVNAVSDAAPSTLDLLAKVANKLEENKAAAVSVKQIPRMDADLFAVWSVWQHYQFIFGDTREDIWVSGVKNYESLAPIQKRKLAIIDDVFVLHRAENIKKEKYNNEIRYAEDLLLSINYIKKGIKIGVLQSESVIHSHSRPPEYFIKRYFVDANVIHEVFGIIPNNINKRYIAGKEPQIYSDLLSIVKPAESKITGNGGGDAKWLEKYLSIFDGRSQLINKKISNIWGKLYDEVYEKFIGFMSQTGERLEGHEDVESRVAAMTSGTLLSEYFLKSTKKKKATPFFKDFKEFLEKGI